MILIITAMQIAGFQIMEFYGLEVVGQAVFHVDFGQGHIIGKNIIFLINTSQIFNLWGIYELTKQ